MQKVIFFITATLAFVSCGLALWNRDLSLAAAWASAFCGWLSALITYVMME